MNKSIILVCLIGCVLCASVCYGQKKNSAPEKTEKESYKKFKSLSSYSRRGATELLSEADDLKKDNPGEALNKVEEALGISIAQGDDFNESKCYLLIGEINEGIQEWKLAHDNYFRAHQKLIGTYTSTPEYRNALRGLGTVNTKLGNFEEALKYFQEGLNLSSDNNDKKERQLDISEVYYQMSEYDQSLKAIDNLAPTGDPSNSSFANRLQNQKAKIYAQLNKSDKSQDIYQNSLNTFRSSGRIDQQEQQSLQNAKEEIATVLRGQNKFDEEIDLRNKSIEYNLESNNLTEVTKDKVAISKTLVAKGDDRGALRQLEEAALIADTLDNPHEQMNAFLALAMQYEKNGRTNQALAAYQKYARAVAKTEKQNERQSTEKSTLIEKQNDIEALTKNVSLGKQEETLEQATVFRQQLIIYGLLFIILIIGITSYFIYKNAKASKVANQLLALKSLRSQMNPHFIFNALNSVNQFISQQDERTANKFLSEFSRLMRLVLENSQEDFISLSKEQEILSLYLTLEHYRFRDKFDYEIKTDAAINVDSIQVPPMLIQPYIENAIWHGLRYKDTQGKLGLHFYEESGNLVVKITDDGIGRKKSAEIKTENQKKHNSTGLRNIQERLAIINEVYHSNYRVTVSDPEEGTGTLVQVYLPLNNQPNKL